jgi:hypothetical protein
MIRDLEEFGVLGVRYQMTAALDDMPLCIYIYIHIGVVGMYIV